MESLRVGLVFENGHHILTKSQKCEGLKRSWVLLNPQQHRLISHFSSHLLQLFNLHQSCPNGLLLSMEGFVLPPFESTSILKDKDIIGVKKKGATLSDVIGVNDEENSVEEVEIVEKQPLHAGLPLLANEEFVKETGGYQSESEEDEGGELEGTLPVKNVKNSLGRDAISKKRKASGKLQKSKKKKRRSVVIDSVENEEKVLADKSKPNIESNLEISEKSNSNVESTPIVKKSDQLQENGQGIKDVSLKPEGTKKTPSRSARRKKAKRQWLREIAKIEKKDVVCQPKGLLHWKPGRAKAEKKEAASRLKGLLHYKKLPEKDVHKDMAEHERPHQNSDAVEGVAPIVVRPGYIRFEPLGKDEAGQQNQASVQTFQWNRITSKKKGQKWGQENFSNIHRNDYKDSSKDSEIFDEERLTNDPIDFDMLPPLPSMPKEGETIAYRVIELSSSWTPELSSFRVGKISRYNPKSGRIVLMPVPEYPLVSEHSAEDSSALQPDNSRSLEDGSLEVDFKSLIDIRVVKYGNSGSAKAASSRWVSGGPSGNKEAISSLVPSNKGKQKCTPTPENGELNVWDRLVQRGSNW